MDIRQFEYILTLAEAKFISRAAERLNISQPTLSQFLSRLEEEFGTPLFHRSRNGFVPTQAGEIYLDGAQRIIRINAEIHDRIDRMKRRSRNCLVIGCTPGRSAAILTDFLPVFSRDSIGITIQMVEAPVMNIDELVKNGYLDLALVSENRHDRQLEFEPFVSEDIVFILNRKHPLCPAGEGGTGGLTRCPDLRLFRADKFVLSRKGYRLREIVDEYLERIGLEPTVLLETTENQLTTNMVHNNLAVGFVPIAFTGMYDDVVPLSLEPKLSWRFGVQYRKGMHVTPQMRRFIDLLCVHIRNRDPAGT